MLPSHRCLPRSGLSDKQKPYIDKRRKKDEDKKFEADGDGAGTEGILPQEPGDRWDPGHGRPVYHRAGAVRGDEGQPVQFHRDDRFVDADKGNRYFAMKRKGNVVDILPSMILLIAAMVLLIAFFDLYQALDRKEDVKQLSRRYMLSMETVGYLEAADKARLLQDLADLGITDVDLTGTTMSDAGYGNAIYLQISCKLPLEDLDMAGGDILSFFFKKGSIPISIRRVSTAKN